MSKITNWSKAHLKNDWLHDEKRHTIKIRSAGGKSGLYDVVLYIHALDRQTRENHKFRKLIASTTSMEEARKRAVDWMRKHPNSVHLCGEKR